MYFHGVVSKGGDGAGVWIKYPRNDSKLNYFQLVFECTNYFKSIGTMRFAS